MVLAALLVNELLLTASLSTVLAVSQTLSLSSAEFWPLELCASLLCLTDSETWNLNLPGNLGRVSSSEVSDLKVLDQETQSLEKVDCPSYVLQHNVLSDSNDKDVVYEDCALGTLAQCS